MRNLRFRAWIIGGPGLDSYMTESFGLNDISDGYYQGDYIKDAPIMAFTGLHDKFGKEIYEFMELNGKYEVIFISPKYVLKDISNNDIIDFYEQNKLEITREYTKI